MKTQKEYSPEHIKYLSGLRRKKLFILGMQIAVLASLLLLWELLTAVKVLDSFMFSSPSRILATSAELIGSGEIWKHFFTTLWECVLGFAAATLLGAAVAIILWWNKTLQRITEPYIIVLNSLPKVALGPIIIMWAGVGITSIVTMCILICVVVTIIGVLSGFNSCDHNKLLLMQSMGAKRFQVLTKLMLPYSVPNLLSILKMNIGLSWVGTIMGEYLNSRQGLGYLILYGGQVFRIDLIMTSIVFICLLATGMYLLVSLAEKLLVKQS